MRRHLFIINPVAGRGGAAAQESHIRKFMDLLGEEYEVRITGYPGHAREMVASLDTGAYIWRVYACGGDGTLNEAAAGAVGRPGVAVTHYPCGTGNDFIKALGDPKAFRDLEKLVNGAEREIDCVELGNGRYAINICSVGVDADVAAGMARFKWFLKFGSKAPYNLSLLYNVAKGIHRPYEAEVDGERLDGQYCMLTVCSGQTYGGGFHACPDAVPDDGVLEFLLVRRVSRLKLAQVIGTFAAGGYKKMPELVVHKRGKRLSFKTGHAVNINYDGEIYKDREAVMNLSPHRIKFIVPLT